MAMVLDDDGSLSIEETCSERVEQASVPLVERWQLPIAHHPKRLVCS